MSFQTMANINVEKQHPIIHFRSHNEFVVSPLSLTYSSFSKENRFLRENLNYLFFNKDEPFLH